MTIRYRHLTIKHTPAWGDDHDYWVVQSTGSKRVLYSGRLRACKAWTTRRWNELRTLNQSLQ